MPENGVYVTLALMGLGSLLLLVAGGGILTGNLNIVGYAVPVAFVGGLVTFLGVRRLERTVDVSA